jgi:hypothetical protein
MTKSVCGINKECDALASDITRIEGGREEGWQGESKTGREGGRKKGEKEGGGVGRKPSEDGGILARLRTGHDQFGISRKVQ